MTSVEPAVKYFLLKITKSVMKGKHLNSWVTTSVPIQSSSIVTKVQSKHHRSCTTITAPLEKLFSSCTIFGPRHRLVWNQRRSGNHNIREASLFKVSFSCVMPCPLIYFLIRIQLILQSKAWMNNPWTMYLYNYDSFKYIFIVMLIPIGVNSKHLEPDIRGWKLKQCSQSLERLLSSKEY